MPTPADSRRVERCRGAVVFADLSGFTSLVQTLGDERALRVGERQRALCAHVR